MKKTLTVIALLAGAVSGYSQGEILFNFYNSAVGQVRQSIWNTQSAAASTYAVTYGGKTVNEEVGSTSAGPENPKGTTVYAGTGLSGSGYDIQLLAGPAGIATVGGTSSQNGANNVGLAPVSSIFNFKTSVALSGYQSGSQTTVTLPTQSYFSGGDQVSLAVAAWNNEGGTVTTLAAAVAGGTPWGISPVVQSTFAGGLPVPNSPSLPLPTTLEGFSLGVVATPEPSTIALGVMGASALLFRRRK